MSTLKRLLGAWFTGLAVGTVIGIAVALVFGTGYVSFLLACFLCWAATSAIVDR